MNLLLSCLVQQDAFFSGVFSWGIKDDKCLEREKTTVFSCLACVSECQNEALKGTFFIAVRENIRFILQEYDFNNLEQVVKTACFMMQNFVQNQVNLTKFNFLGNYTWLPPPTLSSFKGAFQSIFTWLH